LIANDTQQYYSAESLQSILVCTGVYNRETYDETSGKNYAHRDIVIDQSLKVPSHVCEHVLEAIKLVCHLEQFQ